VNRREDKGGHSESPAEVYGPGPGLDSRDCLLLVTARVSARAGSFSGWLLTYCEFELD
jgi:hypothetical protein